MPIGYKQPSIPQAAEVFTDRQQPRATLEAFLDRLYRSKVRGPSGSECPLVHFYGVGGAGKTTLLRQAQAEFRQRHQMDADLEYVHLALLDLADPTLNVASPGEEILWKLRCSLQHARLATPLFDCVYVLMWEEAHQGQSFQIPRAKSQDMIDSGLGILDTLVDSAGLFKGARALWGKGVNHRQRQRAAEKWGATSPETWPQNERRQRLAQLLYFDIVDALENTPSLRLGLLIDEFERIQATKRMDRNAQDVLAELLVGLFFSDSEAVQKRFCTIVMGREVLRWNTLYNPEWETLIESHILGGLSAADAREFLVEKVAPWFAERGKVEISNSLVRWQDEILALTNTGRVDESEHLPFHLDLVVEAICMNPQNFSPTLLADKSSQYKALEDRFLRYLKVQDERLLNALQALALAISFDRSLFDDLIDEKYIVGFAKPDFESIVGDDHSYVGPSPAFEGYHLFHRQMQLALVNSLISTPEGKNKANEILQKIIEYQIKAAQFESSG